MVRVKMELTVDEGRVYGARFHTIKPLFTADGATWFSKEWKELEDWCMQAFGPTPEDGIWTPGARWYINNSKFYFRDEKDMEWFLLRWS